MYKKAAEPTEYGTGGTVTGWGFNRNAKTLLLSPTNNFKIKRVITITKESYMVSKL